MVRANDVSIQSSLAADISHTMDLNLQKLQSDKGSMSQTINKMLTKQPRSLEPGEGEGAEG